MKIALLVLLVLPAVLLISCKQKIGMHKMVQFEEVDPATDDVYIKFLSEQINQYPSEEDNYIKLASIYKKQSHPVKAISLLERGKDENPESLNILIDLASLYLDQENIEQLSQSLKKIRVLDPDHMDFLKLSAGYSLLRKDYTNAIFFANRAMLANPYDDENYYLRGSAQLINKDSLSALISFEEAYSLKNSFRNFAKVFDVSLAVGDHKKARQFLEEYSKLSEEEQFCYQWGVYYNEIGVRDIAKSILLNCREELPGESRVNFELAKIYYRVNNVDSTLFYVNQFLESKPDGTGAYVLKAKTLEKIDYYSEAKKIYNMALEIDSTSTLAIKGLDDLERKVAYLRLVNRKEEIQREVESLKPLKSKVIN